jgi:hypothetical protein
MRLATEPKSEPGWHIFSYIPSKDYIDPRSVICTICKKMATPHYKKICVACQKENDRQRRNAYARRYKQSESGRRCYERNSKKREEYRIKNKEKINERQKKYFTSRRKTDNNFRLSCNLRVMLYQAFKRHRVVKSKTFEKYGLDINAILKKLGTPPSDKHSIDHIIPCAAFDFSNDDDVRRCFSPENLQWLTRGENSKKSSLMEIDGKLVRVKYKRRC